MGRTEMLRALGGNGRLNTVRLAIVAPAAGCVALDALDQRVVSIRYNRFEVVTHSASPASVGSE